MSTEFEKFPKIPRMTSEMQMTITEKLDGTNAQINIFQDPGCSTHMAGSPSTDHHMPTPAWRESKLCIKGSNCIHFTFRNMREICYALN